MISDLINKPNVYPYRDTTIIIIVHHVGP